MGEYSAQNVRKVGRKTTMLDDVVSDQPERVSDAQKTGETKKGGESYDLRRGPSPSEYRRRKDWQWQAIEHEAAHRRSNVRSRPITSRAPTPSSDVSAAAFSAILSSKGCSLPAPDPAGVSTALTCVRGYSTVAQKQCRVERRSVYELRLTACAAYYPRRVRSLNSQISRVSRIHEYDARQTEGGRRPSGNRARVCFELLMAGHGGRENVYTRDDRDRAALAG